MSGQRGNPVINQVSHPWKAVNGAWHTKVLFVEYNLDRHIAEPRYSVSDEARDGKPSLKKLYIDCNDLSEYTFAIKYLGGFRHWKELCAQTFFQPHLRLWREELETKIRGEALSNLLVEAKTGKLSFQANKFILEGHWKVKDEVGRPSKEKIKHEAEKIFQTEKLKDHEIALLSDDGVSSESRRLDEDYKTIVNEYPGLSLNSRSN